jgi:hydrogenase small subunit
MSFRSSAALGAGPGPGFVQSLSKVHVFWLSGMSCDGCTVSMMGASNPAIEDLKAGVIPLMPNVELHHPMMGEHSGDAFMDPFKRALAGALDAPYIVVLEGSVPDDQALPPTGGCFAALGVGGFAVRRSTGQSDRVTDWLAALAPRAAACIAIGTCAAYGGIPAAAGNITGSMGMMDYLGAGYRSSAGIPVINVPGCAPVGDNFTEVLVTVLSAMQNVQPLPEFDELGRPVWMFGETVHRHCPKAGYYEEGVFSEAPGDNQCLVEIGCWGPVVQCNIVERGAINHLGGCMVAGGACIGCTMPGFPDKYAPFYKTPPGSFLSGTVSKVYGSGIRRLRRLSVKSGNTVPTNWDNAHEVPTPWARAYGGKTPVDKVESFFYRKLQYHGSADLRKKARETPLPQTMDILRKEGLDFERSVPVLQEPIKPREEIR